MNQVRYRPILHTKLPHLMGHKEYVVMQRHDAAAASVNQAWYLPILHTSCAMARLEGQWLVLSDAACKSGGSEEQSSTACASHALELAQLLL